MLTRNLRKVLALSLVLLFCGKVLGVEFQSVTLAGKRFTICQVDLKKEHLALFLNDDTGHPFKAFDPISKAVSMKGQKLIFAMNAGMYEENYAPVGLFVADGKQLAHLNLRNATGNFYMKPGGVFMVGNGGARIVDRETYPAVSSDVQLATQSGPMLVQYGKINPLFNPASVSRLIRNGVGVTSHGEVIFAIAEDPVNFYEFATLFRDLLHCPDALFLDGTVSSLFAPALGRDDIKIDLGPIIGVTK